MGYNLNRALFDAAAKWESGAVEEFVEAWADINFYTEDSSVLEQACLSWDLETVEYLVENNVDLTDEGQWLGLVAAAQLEDLEIFNYLIEKGAIIDPKYWRYNVQNILVAAAYGGHWDLVKTCVEKGVDINGKRYSPFFQERYNSLDYAIKKRNFEMIKFLLENWIDQEWALDKIIEYLFTQDEDIEIIKYFLEKWYSFNDKCIGYFIYSNSFNKDNKDHIQIFQTLLNRMEGDKKQKLDEIEVYWKQIMDIIQKKGLMILFNL